MRPTRLPAGFFGISASGTLLGGRVNLLDQLRSMRSVGTGSIRFPVYWSDAQPYSSPGEVPSGSRASFVEAGGHPTAFAAIDKQVLEFAERRLHMLPVVLQAPPWARVDQGREWSPPANPQDFGTFVGVLVKRYGPGGAFWSAYPQYARFAPRAWQVWNEQAGGGPPEGSTLFWDGPKPYEPRYVEMLRDARAAARAADRHAEIVLGGMFGDSWDALAALYKYGAAGSFDAVAVHPYASSAAHVLRILQLVRRVMKRNHASRLPMLVTETSWASALGHVPTTSLGIETTERRQASNLAQEYPLLISHRAQLNLRGIYWYTWIGAEPGSDEFDYAGLLRLTPSGQIQRKPAYFAYVRTLRRFQR